MRRLPRCSAVAAVFVALAAPRSAEASPWHLQLSAATNFPLDLSLRLDVEGPHRLRLSTSVGVMPDGYVRALNAVSVSAGWYSESEGELIRTALQSSLVWRTHLGWRPFAREGFTVMVGYGLATLGGGASAQELLAGVTGAMPSRLETSSALRYSVRSTLHMVDVELGWEWTFFGDRLVIHTALGFAGTFAASTRITPDYTPRAPQAVASFTAAGERYLDDLYRSYVFTPVLSVGAGYRFF